MILTYLALGTNLGDRRERLAQAERSLAELMESELCRMSPVYETAPVGGPAGQEPFLNGAAELETRLSPHDLLEALQNIEREAGRPEESQRTVWGPRELDLDLLLYGDWVLNTPDLTVPHPHMAERWFVLRPLADLRPGLVLPDSGRTVAELLEAVT